MSKRVQISESELQTLYVQERLTQYQIAEKHGSTPKTIRKLMRLLGIPIREQKTD